MILNGFNREELNIYKKNVQKQHVHVCMTKPSYYYYCEWIAPCSFFFTSIKFSSQLEFKKFKKKYSAVLIGGFLVQVLLHPTHDCQNVKNPMKETCDMIFYFNLYKRASAACEVYQMHLYIHRLPQQCFLIGEGHTICSSF